MLISIALEIKYIFSCVFSIRYEYLKRDKTKADPTNQRNPAIIIINQKTCGVVYARYNHLSFILI